MVHALARPSSWPPRAQHCRARSAPLGSAHTKLGLGHGTCAREDGGAWAIETRDGRSYRARRLILAVGTSGVKKRIGVAGEDLPHVSHTCGGALDAAEETRTLLVIGAVFLYGAQASTPTELCEQLALSCLASVAPSRGDSALSDASADAPLKPAAYASVQPTEPHTADEVEEP